MAMPPGGQSSWHHSSDSYQLIDQGERVPWAMLNTPLSRSRLQLTTRSSHSASSWHYVFDVDAEGGAAIWTFHHPELPGGSRRLTWTAATAAHDLVPYPAVHQRGQFGDIAPGALLLATIEVTPGAIAVLDPRGAARVLVRLGGEPDPDWPAGERGVVADQGQVVATFCLPTGGGRVVNKVAVSLP
jgi:hypothetical protein